jgi:tetratricopeptide (TPR) repeat protein
MPFAASAASTEIDPALSQAQQEIATSNLISRVGAEAQIKLDLARKQREELDFDQATKTLVSILDSDIPEDNKRTALLELAGTEQQVGQSMRAIQVFAQYLQRYPMDPGAPEALLRQALLYRRMGAYNMALAKFYAVMTAILNLKLDNSGYYQHLVLQAQTEIADTYYLQGNFSEAADFYERLTKLDSADLNKAEIHLKLLRCLSASSKAEKAMQEAEDLLATNPNEAEARFLLAVSLQQLGHNQEAMRQALFLLESPEGKPWKQSIGNQIANVLYTHGDYTNALLVYRHLSQDDPSPEWQIPIFYQIGLIYERLQQPEQAINAFTQEAKRGSTLGPSVDPSLQVVLDMGQLRKNYLAWQAQAMQVNQSIHSSPALPATR